MIKVIIYPNIPTHIIIVPKDIQLFIVVNLEIVIKIIRRNAKQQRFLKNGLKKVFHFIFKFIAALIVLKKKTLKIQ